MSSTSHQESCSLHTYRDGFSCHFREKGEPHPCRKLLFPTRYHISPHKWSLPVTFLPSDTTISLKRQSGRDPHLDQTHEGRVAGPWIPASDRRAASCAQACCLFGSLFSRKDVDRCTSVLFS